ncbi:MAG: InlB B-repeat-containing protein, partial [Clostridia bacterium]|nr:InlB B-repeat-containing protein [Clostridia bacterium]
YMWNYDGAPNNGVCNVATIKTNSKTQAFAAQRENFYLGGWYTDEQCTTKFDFTKRVTKSVTLFAKWLNIFTFEAEYVDLTGMIGNGYSGQTAGKGLIQVAKAEHMASNGHYVGWMYKEGNTLTFNINSDKAVSDAVLVLRLSAEFYDMTFSPSNYTVSVNGTALNYNAIEMTNVPIQGSNQYKAFANFTISTTVQLNEGANVVQLVISNADRLGESGTMYATAPLTDCIYIYTDAQLTWNPLLDNID